MAKKIVTLLLVVVLTLTYTYACAEENTTPEWISVEEARQLFKEAIGEDCSFNITCRTAYRIDGNPKAWIQMEAQYGDTGSGTGLWTTDIVLSLNILEMLEENGATWKKNGFIIDPAIFPYDTPYELILSDDWGTIYLSYARVQEFLEFCLDPVVDND